MSASRNLAVASGAYRPAAGRRDHIFTFLALFLFLKTRVMVFHCSNYLVYSLNYSSVVDGERCLNDLLQHTYDC